MPPMTNDFITIDLRLKTLAAEMVGRVVEHNSVLSEAVRDQVNKMVESGALEAIVRRETEKTVEALVADAFGAYELRRLFRERLLSSFVQALDEQAKP